MTDHSKSGHCKSDVIIKKINLTLIQAVVRAVVTIKNINSLTQLFNYDL